MENIKQEDRLLLEGAENVLLQGMPRTKRRSNFIARLRIVVAGIWPGCIYPHPAGKKEDNKKVDGSTNECYARPTLRKLRVRNGKGGL